MLVRFTTPVTLVTKGPATGEDALGNDTFTPTNTTTDGVFAPKGSTELTQGQDQVSTQPTVFLRNIDVTAYDQILINGETFEVDGTPNLWPANAFTGWTSEYPLEVTLKRVTG